MKSNSFLKNNFFFFSMIIGIVLGIIVGFTWPNAGVLEPLGTLFINMMFCVVVPMVFFSISSSIANMKSAKRAGKLMGTTVVTFMCTTIIASVIMYVLVRFIPVYTGEPAFEPGASEPMSAGAMIVGFFTKPDFPELWSRRSILQLIIAGIFFGFGVQMCGGPETKLAGLLNEITQARRSSSSSATTPPSASSASSRLSSPPTAPTSSPATPAPSFSTTSSPSRTCS